MIDSFGCTVSAGIHPPDPFHLVVGFQRFRNALRICHLLYQPKKKRRLGITPKTCLVEMAGIEPASENRLPGLSTSVAALLTFPPRTAEQQALRISSL